VTFVAPGLLAFVAAFKGGKMKSGNMRSRLFLISVRIASAVLVCTLFVGVALAAGLTDASVDDFYLGSGCYVSQADTGQTAGAVIIIPTAGTIFSGTVLDSGWFVQSPGFVANGNLYVDNGRGGAIAPPVYPAGRSLEFVATFRNAEFQDVGFASDLVTAPWALFSTGTSGQLRALSDNNFNPQIVTNLGTATFDTPHLYRIDWSTTDVIYSIDGLPVATHTLSFAQGMRPMAEDFEFTTGISLPINWIRMSDYAPSPCTFTSRVINSGVTDAHWTYFTTTVALPAGTSISFDVRAHNTDINSGTWVAVTANAINVTGRYVQYRAILTTNNPLVTPQLLSAVFAGETPTAVKLTMISAAPTTSPQAGWLVAGLSGAGLLGCWWIYRVARHRRQL
jgi:hypothetical protein